jgi:hypothetical protein
MTPKSPSWRRILAFGALWLSISGAALLAPGCYGRNCEGGVEVFGVDAGQGEMLSETRWQSTPFEGTWLWFPRQRLYIFDIPALGGRTPDVVWPYLSAAPEPMKTGDNFTAGAGNIALLSGVGPNRVSVKNDSCSDYYLRLVVDVEPLPPPINGGADAGIADAADAGGDASDAGETEAGP